MFNLFKNKKFRCLILLLVLLLLIQYFSFENNYPVLSEYTVKSNKIPKSFDCFKIAQVSDLHNAKLCRDNERVFKLLEEASPDIIVITGDMIDSRKTDVEAAASFASKAVEIAPCYYVTGNHEERVSESCSELLTTLEDLGITVLRGATADFSRGEDSIQILGIDDPMFESEGNSNDTAQLIQNSLSELSPPKNTFSILLAHRPEFFEVYRKSNVDLVFSGHAHGGQIRIGSHGLIAPGQGILPKYDAGMFTKNDCIMIVSRGIGNSIFPLRINNRPEIVLVTLKSAQ